MALADEIAALEADFKDKIEKLKADAVNEIDKAGPAVAVISDAAPAPTVEAATAVNTVDTGVTDVFAEVAKTAETAVDSEIEKVKPGVVDLLNRLRVGQTADAIATVEQFLKEIGV
jgi:hypothetical protein